MKKYFKLLLTLIISFCFITNVYAISNKIIANKSSKKYSYIEDLAIYYNQSGNYDLYVLDYDTTFDAKTTLNEPSVVDAGFYYIISNNNVTSNSNKNYYIAQVAILWYQDYLNGNNLNIPKTIKEYISSNTDDKICYYINQLVKGAKAYSGKLANIEFVSKNIEFTKSENYYYSNEIEIKTTNLNSDPEIKLINAPKNTKIVNNTLISDGVGTFKIKIPVSSYENISETFKINITGEMNSKEVYAYSNDNIKAIYGRVYNTSSNNIETSLEIKIKQKTDIKIKVVDNNSKYINGITFDIYTEDCSNTICNEKNLITTFTTTKTYTTLTNVLESGIYTIVRKTNNSKIPEKTVITIEDTKDLQTLVITELEEVKSENTPEEENNNSTNDSNNSNIIINGSTSTDGTNSTTTSTTINGVTIENKVDVEVKVDWVSDIIDCPITSVSSTIKYILGAIILGLGTYLVFKNVKKSKNNN